MSNHNNLNPLLKHILLYRQLITRFLYVTVAVVLLVLVSVSFGTTRVAHAASITVTTVDDELNSDGDCSLREAIQAANTDSAVDACTTGSGADTITLAPGGTYTLTGIDNTTEGKNGLPSITSDITINGNGATIERDAVAPAFRIFHVSTNGNLTLNEVTVRNGRAVGSGLSLRGGGIFQRGTVTITNSTISGNSASFGGGINNIFGTVTITNSTISGNSATLDGGGILNGETLTITNSILSGNTATPSAPDCIGSIGSGGYNLIGNNSGCFFSSTTGDQVGTPGSPIDSLIGPLQDNGGPTFTRALLPGSSAIDMGNPAAPGSGGNACELTDQRGFPRATCDVGAFELRPGDLSLTKGVSHPSPLPGNTITYTLTLSNAGPSSAIGVQVTDQLPPGVTYVGDDSGGKYDPNTGVWDVDTLAASVTAVLNITAMVDIGTVGTTITNTAEVTTSGLDDIDSIPDNDDPSEDDQDSVDIMSMDCSVEVTLDYQGGNLNMDLLVESTITTNLEVFLKSGRGMTPVLTQRGLPATSPPSLISHSVSLGPSGMIGVLATMNTSTKGIECLDLQTIDTGDAPSSPPSR